MGRVVCAGGTVSRRTRQDHRGRDDREAIPQRAEELTAEWFTQIPENFAVGDALRSYKREIVVYQKLRTTLGVPMPGYYHGAMDPDPAPWMQRPLFFLFDHLSVRAERSLFSTSRASALAVPRST